MKINNCEYKDITDWMVSTGTQETSNGNWNFYFDEVADEFGVSITWVYDNAKDIADFMDQNYEEILSETWIDDGCFDINFGLAYCPNVEGDGCVW